MNTLIALLAAAGSFGTVLMFGTLGEILTEKSGSLNLGVEGIMYMGGAFGLAGAYAYEAAVGVGSSNGLVAIICAILASFAVGAFAGRVLVRHGAQKTSSQETNQNLCASRTARMYTQPMLEIYADDVKCAHGSTVGQLNDAALFYMRQRGISLDEARLLLEFAFINEVIDTIRLEPLKDRLHYLVEKRFRGELNKCEGCKLCH